MSKKKKHKHKVEVVKTKTFVPSDYPTRAIWWFDTPLGPFTRVDVAIKACRAAKIALFSDPDDHSTCVIHPVLMEK